MHYWRSNCNLCRYRYFRKTRQRKRMKTLILTLFFLPCFAQDTLFMSKINTSWADQYSKLTQFDHLQFDNGETLSIGDNVLLGVPNDINYQFATMQRIGLNFWSVSIKLPGWFRGREPVIKEIRMCKGKQNTPSLVLDNGDTNIIICNIQHAVLSGEIIASRQVK